MARVGLLGGTFNPPHLAHLVCAQEALVQLGLDRVLLVPVGIAPHKRIEADPGAGRRVAMCHAAVSGDERLGVSRADADRGGPSYTFELLATLRDSAPRDELTFIVGGDMARSLPEWREPGRVLALARLAVAERADVDRAAIERGLDAIPGAGGEVSFFAMPRLDISSSMIRRRIGAGQPVRYLVPDAVLALIEREALYGASAVGPEHRPILDGSA